MSKIYLLRHLKTVTRRLHKESISIVYFFFLLPLEPFDVLEPLDFLELLEPLEPFPLLAFEPFPETLFSSSPFSFFAIASNASRVKSSGRGGLTSFKVMCASRARACSSLE